MPPSAMIGTLRAAAACAHSRIALIIGTPMPATTRVVQIEPAPMPTFTASTPDPISASVASAVATLPATRSVFGNSRRIRATMSMHVLRVPVRGVDDEHVHAGRDQRVRPLERVLGRCRWPRRSAGGRERPCTRSGT